MNLKFLIASLLFGGNGFALGPLPNGTYAGKMACTGMPSESSQLTITDTGMVWDDQTNVFTMGPSGYFQFNSTSGKTGSGAGHFTKTELQYGAVFDIVVGNHTYPTPGWDSFKYKKGKIYLDSVAQAGPGTTIVCTGVFSKAESK